MTSNSTNTNLLFFSCIGANLAVNDKLNSYFKLFACAQCKQCAGCHHLDACLLEMLDVSHPVAKLRCVHNCMQMCVITMQRKSQSERTAAATLVRAFTRRAGSCDSRCFSPVRHPRRSPHTCSSAKMSFTRLSSPCLPSAAMLLVTHSAAFSAICICISTHQYISPNPVLPICLDSTYFSIL